MARDFVRASSQYFSRTEAVLPNVGTGVTFSCWVFPDDTTASATMCLGRNAADDDRLQTTANGTSGYRASSIDATTAVDATVGSTFSGSWKHGASVFASNTSRTGYLDGSAGSPNTTGNTAQNLNRTVVGGRVAAGTFGGFLDGRMAECAMWDDDLTAFEIAAMSHGVSPMLVRPTNLVAYWPLFKGFSTGDEPDWHGAYLLTETGTVGNVDHPAKSIAYPVP
jgi:hypothetical protein